MERKSLDHHLIYTMQYHMNDMVIDKFLQYLTSIPSKTTNAVDVCNLFDATHPMIISFQITRVASYFNVRKPTTLTDIYKIDLTAEAQLWDPSSLEFSQIELQRKSLSWAQEC